MSRLGPVVYRLYEVDRFTGLLVVLARNPRAALECPPEWDARAKGGLKNYEYASGHHIRLCHLWHFSRGPHHQCRDCGGPVYSCRTGTAITGFRSRG